MNGVQAAVDFPGLLLLAKACESDERFRRQFGTEEACRDWFFRARWPTGFICPGCGSRGAGWHALRKVWQCTRCHKQTSLTAGTLLEGTRKPLRTWFEAGAPTDVQNGLVMGPQAPRSAQGAREASERRAQRVTVVRRFADASGQLPRAPPGLEDPLRLQQAPGPGPVLAERDGGGGVGVTARAPPAARLPDRT
jgi:hypothetical protein